MGNRDSGYVERRMKRLGADLDANAKRGAAIGAAATAFKRVLEGGVFQDWDVRQLGAAPLRADGTIDAEAGAAKLVTAVEKFQAEHRRIQALLDAMPDAAFAAAGIDRESHRAQGDRASAALGELATVIPTLTRRQNADGATGN